MKVIRDAIEWLFIIAFAPLWLPLMIFKGPRERFVANYKALKEEERRNKTIK